MTERGGERQQIGEGGETWEQERKEWEATEAEEEREIKGGERRSCSVLPLLS